MDRQPYIYAKFHSGRYREAVEFARAVERRGFPGVFLASHADRAEMHADNVALSLAILDRTERITVGTAIATIYLRHPHSMASAASLISELHPERFLLGLGVSHVPMHREIGVSHGKPLGDMRAYVETLRRLQDGVPAPPIVLAAMRRKMTELAAEIGDGVMWSTAPLSHMEAAMGRIPRERRRALLTGTSIPTSVAPDPARAREAIRHYLHFYLQLPNYRTFYREAGFGEEVGRAERALAEDDDQGLRSAVSDRMAEDIGIFGTPADVRERLGEWYETGLDFIVLDPVSAAGDPFRAQYEVVDALGQ